MVPNNKLGFVTVCVAASVLYGFSVRAHSLNLTTPVDEQLKERVQAALASDPYFYDAHIAVSIKDGCVILSGIVFSDWDLRDAKRIAAKAANGKRVIDDLSIETGGRR
jgi:osmotically-inducible protein OsmY